MLRKPAKGWPLREVLADIEGADVPGIERWLDALAEWNEKIDLTAASGDDLAWLMCGDAAVLARVLARGATVVDVGTGAGAPGLALALLRPDLHVTLTETLGKRAAFLRTVIGTLEKQASIKLEARDVVAGDYDVAISRATFSPAEWLLRAQRLVHPGGDIWLFLAREAAPEAPAETLSYVDPSGAARRLVRYGGPA